MARLTLALLAALATVGALGGCLRLSAAQPPTPLQPAPVEPVPNPAGDTALAQGLPLRISGLTLDGEETVLEALEKAGAELQKLKAQNTELQARLSAASQAHAALKAEADGLQRQVSQLTQELAAKLEALKKTAATLLAAQATIAELQPLVSEGDQAKLEVPKLRKQLAQAEAQKEELRDQLLKAELARVKAQQDLVALQIVMARQRALLRRRTEPVEARAPAPPIPTGKETVQ